MTQAKKFDLVPELDELNQALLRELFKRMQRERECETCGCLPMSSSELEVVRKFVSDNRSLKPMFPTAPVPATRNLPHFDPNDKQPPK